MQQIIGYIVLGLIAGALGKLIMPGDQKGGCLSTALLGIGGAVVGGFLGSLTGFLPAANPNGMIPGVGSIITATVGAFLLLFIFSKLKKSK